MGGTSKYIPSNEGEKLLGVKRNIFFYYVESGQIRKENEGSEGPNRYNYDDIMKVKEKRNRKKKKTATLVDWVKPDDLSATLNLDFQVYHEALIGDINLYRSWLKRNPNINLAVFDAEDRSKCLAYVNMLPLPETVIMDVLEGKRAETDIKDKEIVVYDHPGAYTILAESAVTHPNHPELLGTLMRKITEFWCDKYPEKYIEKIYAQAASEKGDILIQKLYFAPLYNLADDAFVLDLKRPGASKFIREFQQCLESKKQASSKKGQNKDNKLVLAKENEKTTA